MIDYAAIGAALVLIVGFVCLTVIVIKRFETLDLEIPGLHLKINMKDDDK